MTFMLDEIRQQPDVVRRIMADEFPRVALLAAEVRRRQIAYVYVAARGTSDNAALYGKYLLEIQHGLPVALALTLALLVFFVLRFVRTRAFMPGGLMAILSLFALIITWLSAHGL